MTNVDLTNRAISNPGRPAMSSQILRWKGLNESLLRVESSASRWYWAGGLLLPLILFYFSQHLFWVNDLNDFSEYLERAEEWRKGNFTLKGGSDILLSVVEFLALCVHPHDFLAFYRLTIVIITFFLFASAFVFVVRETSLMPSFWRKLAAVVLTFAIPHFVFATVTVDQSLLFAACLLLFLGTYDLRYAGPIAVLAFFSRPEAHIIFPLYALLFFLDKGKKKEILINFASFVLMLLAIKLWFSFVGSGPGALNYQEYGFLQELSLSYVGNVGLHVLTIPLLVLTHAYEAFQSSLLWLVFAVGLVVSVKDRRTWAFYGILVFYFLAGIALFAETETHSFPYYVDLVQQMRRLPNYFIVNAYNWNFDVAMGHGRYRLVLYPAFAVFFLQGLIFLANIARRFLKPRYPQFDLLPNLLGIAAFAVAAGHLLLFRYPAFAAEYRADRQLKRMDPIHKLGLEIRKLKPGAGAVLIDNNTCDKSKGSFFAEMYAFSGMRMGFVRICPGAEIWTKDGTGSIILATTRDVGGWNSVTTEYLLKFDHQFAHVGEIADGATVNEWQDMARTYEAALLRKNNVAFIISAKEVSRSYIKLVAVRKDKHLYRVLPEGGDGG